MSCSTASTLKAQASVPVLPPVPGLPPAGQQVLKLWAQQVLSQIQGAAGATGVNVIPQQYALLAGSALPPISATSNCTVTQDTGTVLFGAGSYKIAITGSPATVTLAADTAWPLHPGYSWLASFFQQASAAIAGVLTITTAAGSYTTDFTTTTSGWQRLFDTLNLIADSSTAFGVSFTFTGGTGQNVWLDGLMMEPYFNVAMQPSPFISTSAPLTLDNNPDGSIYQKGQRYAFGNNSNTATWMHVGTLILNDASSASLRWHAGNGYNAGANQQTISDIFIRSSNSLGGAPNLAGISVITHGNTQPIIGFKAYATGGNTAQTNTSWELYANCATFTYGPLEVAINSQYGDSFTFSGASASDPGPASSTVVVGYVGQYLDPTQGSGLDGLPNGTTYARFLASGLTSGIANTQGLVSGAATDVIASTTSSSQTIASGTSAPYASTIASVSVGPYTENMSLVCTGSYFYENNNASNASFSTYITAVIGASGTYVTNPLQADILAAANGSPGFSGSMTVEGLYTLTAGDTVTINLEFQEPANGESFTIYQGAMLKVEVIKR